MREFGKSFSTSIHTFRYLVGPAGNLMGDDLVLFGADTSGKTNSVKVPDTGITDKDIKEVTAARLDEAPWKKVSFTMHAA